MLLLRKLCHVGDATGLRESVDDEIYAKLQTAFAGICPGITPVPADIQIAENNGDSTAQLQHFQIEHIATRRAAMGGPSSKSKKL